MFQMGDWGGEPAQYNMGLCIQVVRAFTRMARKQSHLEV